MTTIETNGRTLVVVEVPKADRDKSNFSISEHGNLFGISKHGELMQCDTYINLTGYNVIGLLSELTAEQCEPYAPYLSKHEQIEHSSYPDYLFRCLLTKNGIDTQKNLLIIEKIK